MKIAFFLVLSAVQAKFIVASGCPIGEFPGGHLFTNAHLEAISQTASAIIRNTGPHDVLVFLGRSPLYIAESIEAKGANRNIRRVAFSMLMADEPDRQALRAFRNYLGLNDLSPWRTTKGKIFIIDHLSRGHTVRTFAQILKDWAVEEGDIYAKALQRKIEVFNLTSREIMGEEYESGFSSVSRIGPRRSVGLPVTNFYMSKDTLDKLITASADESLGVHYPPTSWALGFPRSSPSFKAQEMAQQVRQYR